MTSIDLRESYIKYFKSLGHEVLGSSSLKPENDPTVLFTTAGMQPLVPYLLGEKHPRGKRLVAAQKCIRTDDIDEIGDAVHHTFFEMLGNWSLGDYFKQDAIQWSYEFLTSKNWLGLDKENLAVSVFAGDEDAPFDQEAYDKWSNLGFRQGRVAKMPKAKNWWGPAGTTGPCGPDTEIFYWTGNGKAPENFQESYDNPSWVEVWNNVFMQYKRTSLGKFDVLAQKNVDTGMGLERMLSVMNGLDDNYKTDLFWPMIEELELLSKLKYEDNKKDFRIIADHIKAAVFAIGDGVLPSNKGGGYIVRRLLRRALVKAKNLNINDNFTKNLANQVFGIYKGVYFEEVDLILSELEKEETKFRHTLHLALKELDNYAKSKEVDGGVLFDLFQSKGLPPEVAIEESTSRGLSIKKDAFEVFKQKLIAHQELSRTASAGMFKGGLADASEETKRLHTAAHLLLESLRRVLGDHISQKGSNITPERLRFDFSHSEKLTPDQLTQVEELVNKQIEGDLQVTMREMSLDEAKEYGATGVFEHKYGEIVKVYTIGDFSREICGGPHVEKTGELGHFKITKEESSSSGVRRIKAVLN